MKNTVRAYWARLKDFVLDMVEFVAYGNNSNVIPGPTLPPPDETLKAVTTIGRQPMMWSSTRTYANRRRKK